MAESIVTDWLADYAALEHSEIRTFAAQHEHNHEISSALFTIINERLRYPDVSLNYAIPIGPQLIWVYFLHRYCIQYAINYSAIIVQTSRNWSDSRCNSYPHSSTRIWMRWHWAIRRVVAASKPCCWAFITSKWAPMTANRRLCRFACRCWRTHQFITRKRVWIRTIYVAGRRIVIRMWIGVHCHRWNRWMHKTVWKSWPHLCLCTISNWVRYRNRRCIKCVASHRNWSIKDLRSTVTPIDRRTEVIRPQAQVTHPNHCHAYRWQRNFCWNSCTPPTLPCSMNSRQWPYKPWTTSIIGPATNCMPKWYWSQMQ